ncbi:hypothetical protein PR202_gb29015 [Eleusine coracana subsp. coracana]|uniref:Uncharacterized protein n=1 Tax=Eleusine coracana subsp. coracana TaxID=191504 RepID=A0AAV5FZ59_ELECO|nr:hypothetical protein PR202_gb29015 [Eleusine coracana subsp. coracana]
MQRRIAEELKLFDRKTMNMFEKQDEEDDFNGVDPASRDAIRDVAVVIGQVLRETSFVMVFLNGSDQEIVLHRLGVPEFHEYIIIWTFGKRFPTRGLMYSGTNRNDIAKRCPSLDPVFPPSTGPNNDLKTIWASDLLTARCIQSKEWYPFLDGGKDKSRPTVEMEKDVWDAALEWDGMDNCHHPSLYEAPLHSRCYKRKGLLRGTVLR